MPFLIGFVLGCLVVGAAGFFASMLHHGRAPAEELTAVKTVIVDALHKL